MLQSPTVQVLDLSQNELTDRDAIELAPLVRAGLLRVLKLGYNRIRCNGADALAASLIATGGGADAGAGAHLFALDLRGNFLEKRGVRSLLQALTAADGLKHLDIRDAAGGFGVLDVKYPSDMRLLTRLTGFPLNEKKEQRLRRRPASSR